MKNKTTGHDVTKNARKDYGFTRPRVIAFPPGMKQIIKFNLIILFNCDYAFHNCYLKKNKTKQKSYFLYIQVGQNPEMKP